jgi:NRPS condensation-like uncharacterized protein
VSNSVVTKPSTWQPDQAFPSNYGRKIPKRIAAEFLERAGSAVYPDYALDINAVLYLSDRIDADRMARAVRLLVDAEPILGCRFVERWFRPYWERYDNLDALKFFEFRQCSDCDAAVRQFLETPLRLPLSVLLLRGEADVLCIKFDHLIADGAAMGAGVYLLADIYNRLEHDLDYVPIPNLKSSRSIRQISSGFGIGERWRFFRTFFNSFREAKNRGKWEYPIPPSGKAALHYSIRRLDEDRVTAISRYASRQHATVNQVLLAAFYLAAFDALGHASDLPLPIRTTVDLRRHIRSRKPPGLCNLSGQSLVTIDPSTGTSLEAVVQQIREQMQTQRKEFLGLLVSTFAYQGLPLRYFIDLIPYSYLKRLGRRAIEENRKRIESPAPGDSFRGMVLLTNVGKIDIKPRMFEGTEMTYAFGTTGIVKNPGILGLVVSGFKDSLTLCLGIGPISLINAVSDRMMQVLPE